MLLFSFNTRYRYALRKIRKKNLALIEYLPFYACMTLLLLSRWNVIKVRFCFFSSSSRLRTWSVNNLAIYKTSINEILKLVFLSLKAAKKIYLMQMNTDLLDPVESSTWLIRLQCTNKTSIFPISEVLSQYSDLRLEFDMLAGGTTSSSYVLVEILGIYLFVVYT